jgi:signal peptidase II
VTLARRAGLFTLVSFVSIALDQWTKQLATAALKDQPSVTYLADTFRLSWATNEGAFLSLGASLGPQARYWLLTLGVGALLLGLSAYALFSKKLDLFQVGSYALIASGGFSNWIDRARFGGVVVDFMSIAVGRFPLTGVFNIADIAIVAGIILLFLHGWRTEKRLAAQKQAEDNAKKPAAT